MLLVMRIRTFLSEDFKSIVRCVCSVIDSVYANKITVDNACIHTCQVLIV